MGETEYRESQPVGTEASAGAVETEIKQKKIKNKNMTRN